MPAGFHEKTRCISSGLYVESGGDLLSRTVTSQVPSALKGLTSVFGMGTGGERSECQSCGLSAKLKRGELLIRNEHRLRFRSLCDD